MATGSILQQIIDQFLSELSARKTLEQPRINSLRTLLNSGNFKNDDIAKLIKEDSYNENP